MPLIKIGTETLENGESNPWYNSVEVLVTPWVSGHVQRDWSSGGAIQFSPLMRSSAAVSPAGHRLGRHLV